MEDVRKQLDEMKKQSDEMRKLKAIIVKHENRIRALEASQKARDEDALDAILSAPGGSGNGASNAGVAAAAEPTKLEAAAATAMAPDEV